MLTESEKARAEAVKVSRFIEDWQKANPYNGNLSDHNAKFKAEFNLFLQSGDFSQRTVGLFKID